MRRQKCKIHQTVTKLAKITLISLLVFSMTSKRKICKTFRMNKKLESLFYLFSTLIAKVPKNLKAIRNS